MEAELKTIQGNKAVFELSEAVDFNELQRKADNERITADIEFIDNRNISNQQRRFIYALFGDISDFTGYPADYISSLLKTYHSVLHGLDSFSLSRETTSMEEAGRFIEDIIQFCFDNQIPFKHQEWHSIGADYKKILYWYAVNRKCMVSGEPNADVAHVEAVGMGRNRNKIDHTRHHVLTLSRRYHMEQHLIGIDAFLEKYHLVPVTLKQEDFEKIGVKGVFK